MSTSRSSFWFLLLSATRPSSKRACLLITAFPGIHRSHRDVRCASSIHSHLHSKRLPRCSPRSLLSPARLHAGLRPRHEEPLVLRSHHPPADHPQSPPLPDSLRLPREPRSVLHHLLRRRADLQV